MSRVTEYIKNNWENSIHQPDEQSRGIIKMPKPYSVPCANIKDVFSDFYYWDTYFANLGFMLDGFSKQAENNLDVMAYFIQHLGYMPNANHLLDRSQPPLFTRGVWDLYQYRKDTNILGKYISEIVREYNFYKYSRNTEVNLQQYGCQSPEAILLEQYQWLSERVGEQYETVDEQIEFGRDLLSIAESGWDFTPRFDTKERRFATSDFVHLDLNCLLYDVERTIAKMLHELGNIEDATTYDRFADERKVKMERYMLDKETGIYYDYNFKNGEFSSVVSCASMYPFAVGISDDKEAAKKTLARLELEHGVAACEYRGEDAQYLQWDYPCMWPSNVYFTYMGLKRVGLVEDAKRIAKKYLDTVDKCFEQTGSLWEKYDAAQGVVSVTNEYETPEMMGWTAGVYRFLEEDMKE